MIFPQNRLIRKRSLILYFNSNKLATLKNNNNFLQANLFLFSSLLAAKKLLVKKSKQTLFLSRVQIPPWADIVTLSQRVCIIVSEPKIQINTEKMGTIPLPVQLQQVLSNHDNS